MIFETSVAYKCEDEDLDDQLDPIAEQHGGESVSSGTCLVGEVERDIQYEFATEEGLDAFVKEIKEKFPQVTLWEPKEEEED